MNGELRWGWKAHSGSYTHGQDTAASTSGGPYHRGLRKTGPTAELSHPKVRILGVYPPLLSVTGWGFFSGELLPSILTASALQFWPGKDSAKESQVFAAEGPQGKEMVSVEGKRTRQQQPLLQTNEATSEFNIARHKLHPGLASPQLHYKYYYQNAR